MLQECNVILKNLALEIYEFVGSNMRYKKQLKHNELLILCFLRHQAFNRNIAIKQILQHGTSYFKDNVSWFSCHSLALAFFTFYGSKHDIVTKAFNNNIITSVQDIAI